MVCVPDCFFSSALLLHLAVLTMFTEINPHLFRQPSASVALGLQLALANPMEAGGREGDLGKASHRSVGTAVPHGLPRKGKGWAAGRATQPSLHPASVLQPHARASPAPAAPHTSPGPPARVGRDPQREWSDGCVGNPSHQQGL